MLQMYFTEKNTPQADPGIPASSTTKTGRHDIAEIFLKVALNTKINQSIYTVSLNMLR
jgi:hypothetical protein